MRAKLVSLKLPRRLLLAYKEKCLLRTDNFVNAERIVAHRNMARGVVVLDDNAAALESALRAANILVVTPPTNWSDPVIREQLLSHRMIITTTPAEFVDDAPVYEYGIIALDKLSSIDPALDYAKHTTVRLISTALTKFGLWARGVKFLLELHDDDNHVLKELP